MLKSKTRLTSSHAQIKNICPQRLHTGSTSLLTTTDCIIRLQKKKKNMMMMKMKKKKF